MRFQVLFWGRKVKDLEAWIRSGVASASFGKNWKSTTKALWSKLLEPVLHVEEQQVLPPRGAMLQGQQQTRTWFACIFYVLNCDMVSSRSSSCT